MPSCRRNTICHSLASNVVAAGLLWCAMALTGCGTTKQNTATEQMLNSDAVDAAVAKIDFTPLAGQRVFFDTTYMQNYKGIGFVNAEYVISSMRQQMVAAGLLLQAEIKTADYVVEGRVGALGTDSHEVVYGIPSNSAVSAAASAASAVSGVPMAGSIPELSVSRRADQAGAAKIGAFAYDKETREAVWQSGTSVARATAKDLWILGIGPFQRGTIYNGKIRFAGNALDGPAGGRREGLNGPIAAYREEMIFQVPRRKDRSQYADSPGDAQKPAQSQAAAPPAAFPEKATSGGVKQAGGDSGPGEPSEIQRVAPADLKNPIDFPEQNRR